MGRHSKIAVAAIAILTIAGCSSDGEQAVTPSTAPTPTTAATQAPAATKLAQPFSNPVVAGKTQETTVATATPNLIQPTNSTQRAIDITKGRPDPFAQIVTPSIPIMPTTTGVTGAPIQRVVPQLPTLPPRVSTVASSNLRRRSSVISVRTTPLRRPNMTPNRSVIASSKLPPVKIARGRSFTPVLPRVMPQVVPNPSLVSVLPPTPKPELASAVAVTGIVVVGSEPQAIIKVPTEPTSRYVQAGDRLSNGVQVKRIEMNEGSEPVVIFEQFGIEVARMVGEGAAAPATTASADSAAPPPISVPTGAS
ncbi:hypothetical protein NIES4071_87180 [Calothrix sp. NIES-4071]|nr:hypothetical protein NIES4071_87180 [Calothrix sp. NIES-4071]BAZ62985.1 hypothetical protein NIES4105_87110 [Calothrix sp. NIES-4105]